MKAMGFLGWLVLMSIADIAAAKCAYHQYAFHGVIVNDSTRQPVAGATILIFLDDYESTVSGGYLTKYPDFFVSDGLGRFTALSYFDSYRTSSILSGDICDRAPAKVEVITIAPGFLSKRTELRFGNLKHHKILRWKFNVELPEIKLNPSKSSR